MASERVDGLRDLVDFWFVDVLYEYVDHSVHWTFQHKRSDQICQTFVVVTVEALPGIELVETDAGVMHQLGEGFDVLLDLFIQLFEAFDLCLVLSFFSLEEHWTFFNIVPFSFHKVEETLPEVLDNPH